MAVTALACPKCAAERRDAETACVKCGLTADRMESFAQEGDAAVPDALAAAWDHAIAAWDDPARHDEVLRLVAQQDAYAWAAARYRTRAGDPIGDRQLARVKKAAEVTLYATATARKDTSAKPYRAVIAIVVILIALTVIGLLYVKMKRDTPMPTQPHTGPAGEPETAPKPTK